MFAKIKEKKIPLLTAERYVPYLKTKSANVTLIQILLQK